MKELTEKVIAYDEALERAAVAYKDEDRHLKATLERIFPELKDLAKDPEDERIRMNAINIIRDAMHGIAVPLPLSIYTECIEYLEKQGHEGKVD